ncbi:amine dehydrogenase large subunit [Novosphingobium sp.]|uniref:amine dehydrogenase large subunit n=1 Tax=Novosphingobium sp. TaxID=1874826 RepID=UPI002621793E|nr:amine dehydrogenase large subunit [Novosphingobium sp.]
MKMMKVQGKSPLSARARYTAAAVSALALLGSVPAAHAADPLQPDPELEAVTLSAPKPSWVFVERGFVVPGNSIYDTETGKMLGMVEASTLSDLSIDPAGKAYYVSESIWTKGWRGTRQDMITVYDSATLKLKTEIAIPGRILIGGRKFNFVIADEGKTAYVYNLDPASSVNVVDLAKGKFVKKIELPGCASLMPVTGVGFSALCSDGSLATVKTAAAKPEITRSAPFFSATNDPIFDNFGYDGAKQTAVFLTYTGQVYTAKLGATPTISEPFSIQAAAGVSPADTKPLDVHWYPGARQGLAYHLGTGHAFVLMHTGEYWTHKESGTELWELDVAAKKVVKRIPLEDPASAVAVTQEPNAKLILSGESGTLHILDAKTFEEKFKLEKSAGGVLRTLEP